MIPVQPLQLQVLRDSICPQILRSDGSLLRPLGLMFSGPSRHVQSTGGLYENNSASSDGYSISRRHLFSPNFRPVVKPEISGDWV